MDDEISINVDSIICLAINAIKNRQIQSVYIIYLFGDKLIPETSPLITIELEKE
jgi:hypothetical protein